jgi:hypothetical protein
MGAAIAKPEDKKKVPAPELEAESPKGEHAEGATAPAGLPLFLGGAIQRKCGCGGSAAGECEECRKKENGLG